MLLQKIFLLLKDKYSISINEIEDLFDIEKGISDSIIYDNICVRYESVLKIKFEAMYLEAKSKKNKLRFFLKTILWRKAVDSNIEQDLFMNELNSFDSKFIVSILEKNTIYKFRISDIVNIWMLALTKTDQLFINPDNPKNPYTNIGFSKSALYSIYFKLLDTGFSIPTFITSHIKYNLDIKMFTIRNYPELKEEAILTFMREGTYYEKYEHVVNMLHDYRKEVDYYTLSSVCPIDVRKRVTKVFSNYLFLYLESKYSCNPLIKEESRKRVKEKLKKFIKDEPRFGFSRADVIRYVPLAERAEDRRRVGDERFSARPISNLIPPPIPNTGLSRRRSSIITNAMPPTRPIGPPPPPPPVNEIVRRYNPSTTTLPPLRINNYTNRVGTLTQDDTLTESSIGSLPSLTTIASRNTSDGMTALFNSRNRAIDILQQSEDEINTVDSLTTSNNSLNSTETTTSTEEITYTVEDDDETDDEFGNEFSLEVALDIENPFASRNELNRTPPPIDQDSAIREPLLQPLNQTTTQEMLDRINVVLDSVIEGRQGRLTPNAETETETDTNTEIETNTETNNETNN